MKTEKIIELKARQYLTANNLNCPVDLNHIIKQRQITLVDRKLTEDEAMFIRTDKEKIMIIDKRQSPGQLRFNVAHEIAHDILDVGNTIFTNPSPAFSKEKSPEDIAADIFASELLIPTPVLKRESYRCKYDLDKLVKFFKVTRQAMITKLSIKKIPCRDGKKIYGNFF
ncbi:ImmA/IrrE family metallo-endopeptidase [Orenia marismortui]|uniref:ImmA/IrrE family metallo-endopeptidase n=1 Tax=Orenia marismortui TaxID=46469 RepID=UPI000373A3FC|nr:ImmA/IrrE family metallo-endopeptidase [Orenia marismortui]